MRTSRCWRGICWNMTNAIRAADSVPVRKMNPYDARKLFEIITQVKPGCKWFLDTMVHAYRYSTMLHVEACDRHDCQVRAYTNPCSIIIWSFHFWSGSVEAPWFAADKPVWLSTNPCDNILHCLCPLFIRFWENGGRRNDGEGTAQSTQNLRNCDMISENRRFIILCR